MTHLIDKEKVISILTKKRDAALLRQQNLQKIGDESILNETLAFNLGKVLDDINSLEIEEVDLKKEFDKIYDVIPGKREDIEYIAKHFFELGLKVRKGE